MLVPPPTSKSAGAVDAAGLAWALDLAQPFAALRRHAFERAALLRQGQPAEERRNLQLDLYLLLCAAEQVAADHLGRGGLDFGPIRSRVRSNGIRRMTRGAERVAAAAARVRGRALEGDLKNLVRRLGGAAVELATAMALDREEGGWPQRIVDSFAGPRPAGLEAQRCKMPACFRSQDLTVGDCFELARRFLVARPAPGRTLVVGIRTSGSYMAPLCAGYLRAAGVGASSISVRPEGAHLDFGDALRQLPESVLVVDDPPMTGATLVAVAQRLERLGMDRDRIRLLVPWSLDNALQKSSAFRPAFDEYARVELDPAEWQTSRELDSDGMLAWVGEVCGQPPEAVRLSPSPDSSAGNGRSHLERAFLVDGVGEVVVKGIGLGWFGHPARIAASTLSGRVPPVLGFRGTLMASRRPETRPATRPEPVRVAGYIAAKAHGLSLFRPAVSDGGPRRDGWFRLARLLARAHGPLAPLAIGGLRAQLREAARGGVACLVDGRVTLDDWAELSDEPGSLLKAGYEEHCFDKDDIDWPDPALDLAGSVLALGPSREIESSLLDAYQRLSGDNAAARIGLGELLQAVIDFDRLWWQAESASGSPAWERLVQGWLESESALTWTLERMLTGGLGGRFGPASGELWSIDIDGVLEDYGLGIPATTPAGVESIGRLRRAGAAIFLNTGRSVREVLLRCDALGLDGGVAEYGSALALREGSRTISLLEPDEAQALARIRQRAAELEGVHVDARYLSSVRLRRRAGDRLRALDDVQITTLLAADEGEVEVVQGIRQTDFKSRRRSKATGLTDLIEESGSKHRLFAVGDGLPDLVLASVGAQLYAPAGSPPELREVATTTTGRRQRGLLEAVLCEHPGPPLAPAAGTPGEVVLRSLLGLRDQPTGWRMASALSHAGLEVFRC